MQFGQMIFDLEKNRRHMVQTKYNQKHGSLDLASINGKQGFHRTRNRMKFGKKNVCWLNVGLSVRKMGDCHLLRSGGMNWMRLKLCCIL